MSTRESRRAGKGATAKSETVTASEHNRHSETTQARPLFRLVLRPQPRVDGERALRALLKTALRRFGLQCVSAERVRR